MSEEGSLSTASSYYSLWESMNDWFTPKVLFVLLNVMIGTIVFTSSLANHKQKHQNRQQNEPKNAGIARSPSVLQRLKSINLYAHYYRSHEEPQIHNPNHNSFDSDHTHHFFQDQHSHEYLRQALPLKPQDSYIYDESERTQFVFNEKDPILDGSSQAHEVKARDPTISNGFSQSHELESQTQFAFSHKDQILNDFSQLFRGEKTQAQFAFDQPNGFTQTHKEKTSAAAEQSMDEVYSQLTGGGIHFDRSKSDTKPRSGETPVRMRKSASLKSAFGHFEEDEVISAESRRPATSRVRGSSKATDDDSGVDAKADDFINKFKQQLKLQRLDSIIRYKDMIARGSAKG